ncbi:hypothetical protein [Lysobacter sp. F6437]|uniref:hypothetical protein n=1 Tax=Lysobacter sp. F6437 TaxID=3459296 RepID=UPI00403D5937
MLSRLLYLLPFTYFWSTRLRSGSIGFHVLFEWVAAAVLVVQLSPEPWPLSLQQSLLAYIAFISVYEVGYLSNDLIVAPGEAGGRMRGPQGTGRGWFTAWVVARILAFIAVTHVLHQLENSTWWAFFGALAVVFAMHNWISDREIKAGTFLWLSWFRFMAPIMFVIPSIYLLGVAFACAMSYSAFRQFGYLDSKGLLSMPGRKRPVVRWTFFIWPLLAAAVLFPSPDAKGFVVLTVYYAIIASLGVALTSLRGRSSGRT